jgi:hypothetical protein
VLVNNSDIDTELPYFVGVQSLENHSINICLHVSGSFCGCTPHASWPLASKPCCAFENK